MEFRTEVCIVGGGPAGSTAAARLARLGHEVLLVESDAGRLSNRVESLPPLALDLFRNLDMQSVIPDASARPHRALVRWAGVTREHPHEEAVGFFVERPGFEDTLRAAATAAGARVCRPAIAQRPIWRAPFDWLVSLRGSSVESVSARFLIDASGRRGLVPGRRRRLAPPTLALLGTWRDADLPAGESRLEAGEAHWCWAAPLSTGGVHAAVFLSPRLTDSAAPRHPEHAYRALLQRSELLRGCLAGRRVGGVQARTASSSAPENMVGEDWLRVGDAALALDPLSSQGLLGALRGAAQAAAIVHTILAAPEMAPHAIAFYAAQLREATERHLSLSGLLYVEQARHQPSAFWSERAGHTVEVPAPPAANPAPRPSERLSLSSRTTILNAPVLHGDVIRLERTVSSPRLDRPVAYVGGTALAPLLAAIDGKRTLKEVVALWAPSVPARRAVDLLFWMWSNGLITAEG